MTSDGRTGLGPRAWILVGAVVVTCFVIPAALVLVPPTWLPYRLAFLALPVLPAVGLGLIAVWAALGRQHG